MTDDQVIALVRMMEALRLEIRALALTQQNVNVKEILESRQQADNWARTAGAL